MTLKERIRAGAIITITLVAIGLIFLGNQRPVHAEISGHTIAVGVFCFLDGFPTTDVFTDTGCSTGTPAPSAELTLIKNVVNTGGGTAVPTNWALSAVGSTATSPTSISGITGSQSVTNATVQADTYTLSESAGPANYTPSPWVCTGGGVLAGNSLTLSQNNNVTCTITNTYNVGGGGSTQSDLSVSKTASKTTANVGDSITYTIIVSNAGPATATGVTVNDVLPSSLAYVSDDSASTATSYNSSTGVWTVGAILSGGNDVLHIVATVKANAAGTTVTNTAVASDTNGDPNSENNSGSIGVTVNGSGGGGGNTTSDVAITKSVNNTAPNPGGTVIYTITATDSGADATNVVVNDPLPSGLNFVSTSTADTAGVYDSSTGNWTINSLTSGTTDSLHITATVGSTLENGALITNTAAVTAGDTSDSSANNTASAPITVTIPNNNGGGGTPAPTNSGGGGNGPIVGSYGGGGGGGGNGPIPLPLNGQVLGASTTAPNSCTQYLTAFIKTGQQNDTAQVERLQTFLNTYEGGHLTVNGTYDAPTLAATEAFQKAYGADILTPWGIGAPTGYVYLTTRKEVNTIYCHFTQNFPLTTEQQAIINAALSGTHSGAGNGTMGLGGHRTTATAPKTSGTKGVGTAGQTAAVGLILDTSGTSSNAKGSSSPVANPFNGIGSFFKHLFGH